LVISKTTATTATTATIPLFNDYALYIYPSFLLFFITYLDKKSKIVRSGIGWMVRKSLKKGSGG
jgi:hypothetical protein